MRSIRALEMCDVGVFMVDSEAGSASQDAKIAGMLHDAGKGVIVVFNKWDLIEKETNTHLEVWDRFCQDVPFLAYAPWFTISALSRQRTGRILETVWQVHEERRKRIKTSELNDWLEKTVAYQAAAGPRRRAGQDLLHFPGGQGAADLHAVGERAQILCAQLPAVPEQPAAQGVRLRGQPHLPEDEETLIPAPGRMRKRDSTCC